MTSIERGRLDEPPLLRIAVSCDSWLGGNFFHAPLPWIHSDRNRDFGIYSPAPDASGCAKLKRRLADRRRIVVSRISFLVQQARHQHRKTSPYLIVWRRGQVSLQPESFAKNEEKKPTAILSVGKGEY